MTDDYDKYIKYKQKYLDLRNNDRNMFYYLNEFKSHVIDIVKNSYMNPNNVSKNTIEGMFMKWYLNSINKNYIPKDKFNIKNDLEYQNKKHKFKIPIDNILNNVNREVINMNHRVKDSVENYNYKPILSTLQLEILRKKYTGPVADYEKHRNFLTELYSFMGGTNNHMSVPPMLIPDNCIELFGTPVNTKYKFCSPFAIEKEFFSSLGSFFDYEINSGLYLANPPFDEEIMKNMAVRLNDQLNKQTMVDIIIVIPKWNDMAAYNILSNSKYCIKDTIVSKNNAVFFNYYEKKFVPVVDCYCMHLTNYNTIFSLDDFIYKWSLIK